MSKRNHNGMGTIRQRSDGRYEARYTGSDGKQHSLYGATPTEVSKKLRAATASVDTGDWLQPTRVTVKEWIDTWLRDYCAHLRPSTVVNYRNRAKHIINSIGNIRVAAATTAHARRVISDAQSAGLAAQTVLGLRIVMVRMFNCAVEAKIIKENPASRIKLTSIQPVRDIHIIDRPQIPAFIAAARQTPYGDELIFLLMTGLRISEMLGLTWKNVDFAKSEINVCQQLQIANGKAYITPTKTGETRKIRLMPDALAILKSHRARQNEQRIKAGHLWITGAPNDDLVFRTEQGRFIYRQIIANHTAKAGEAIGIPGLHPHDLRHSYAVAALRSGVDVKTVQYNLGHATAQMTLDVYAKYTEDAGQTAAQLLSAYFSTAVSD